MFKRLFWFSAGTATGFGTSIWIQRRVRATVERYRPSQVGETVAGKVRTLRVDVREAAEEGREAMRSREAALRADLVERGR